MKRLLAAGLLLALLAGGCSLSRTSSKTITQTTTVVRTVTTTPAQTTPIASPCTGDQLSGSFDVQQGSAGAGQIVYTLTLTNTSQVSCFVTGLPVVQLYDAKGNALPTHSSASTPGTGTAVKVTLDPGKSAKADARFSPDVTGVGDSQSGRCQPVAATLQVTPTGGGAVDASISPPTSVCEQGSLHFSNLSAS